ncbi:MAG: hypothetical protein IKO40_01620, partial [Kiritimatiellae bacterium]|nr:hypothetical protein [Kiritimatiellia bacterium]
NREATNVTYTISCGCVYENWVFIDGQQVYYKKRDSGSPTYTFELAAGSCVSIDIVTASGATGGPRSDADKFKINGVVANDPTGWFFTTNAVSGAENAPGLAALDLSGAGALDMNGMPLSVDALSGAGLVTNTAALTVADSWTLAATEIADGAALVVDGALVFGNGCAFNVPDLRLLSATETYTVCRADSISGFPAGGVEITSGQDVWKLFLASGGTELALFNVEHTPLADNEFEVYVPQGETQTIDATLVADIGTKNLVKTGRGTLVSSADMAAYTGTITVREGAFKIRTASDLGTDGGGTVVEDGGTLLVDMTSDDRFSNEQFTIAGTGDEAYGAAVFQVQSNNRFKLFKYLTLSDDATIFAGTHLGVDGGTVAMNGHTLTLKGANFTFRNDSFPASVGNIVTEANLVFQGGSGTIGDPSKTLTVRSGGRVSIADNNMGVVWRLVVEEGGSLTGGASTPKHWGGDVVWNSTVENGVTNIAIIDGELTGTGVVKIASGTLSLAKPPAAAVGFAAFGTVSIEMPPARAYSYGHKGLMTGMRTDGWTDGYNTDRADTRWSYCAYGPGPQLVRDGYWDENDTHSNGKSRYWCSRGYLWNREATNVTYSVFVGSVYRNYIYLDGNYGTAVYDNKRDSWGSCLIEVPARSCRQIDIRTDDGKAYGGPRNDNDKMKINGVIANDPTGWFFTTNAVSGVENPATVASLTLAGDGTMDAKGMPLSVAALSGCGLVTNVTALTVSGSWTLAAADITSGAALVVDGGVVFGNGSTISVSDIQSLPITQTYTVCRADSITGFASGMKVSDGSCVWKLVVADDGKSINLVYASPSTVFFLQ